MGDAENVLNYLIQCQGLTEGSRPFPNTTHGTLGKGPDADRFKVTPLSHPGGTLDTKDGKVCEGAMGGEVTWQLSYPNDTKCSEHVHASTRIPRDNRNEGKMHAHGNFVLKYPSAQISISPSLSVSHFLYQFLPSIIHLLMLE